MIIGRLLIFSLCIFGANCFYFADLADGDNPMGFANDLFNGHQENEGAEELKVVLDALHRFILSIKGDLEISVPIIVIASIIVAIFAFFTWMYLMISVYQSNFAPRPIVPGDDRAQRQRLIADYA